MTEKKKRGGGPSKGSRNHYKGGRTARIVIQCTPKEKAWFTAEAKQRGGITALGRARLGIDRAPAEGPEATEGPKPPNL